MNREDVGFPWSRFLRLASAVERTGQNLYGPAPRRRIASADQRATVYSALPDEVYDSEQAMLLGWSLSALVHGVMLAMAATFSLHMTPPRSIPQKDLFRWDVSLLAAPRIDAMVADGVQPQSQDAVAVPETDFLEAANHSSVTSTAKDSSLHESSNSQEIFAPAVFPLLGSEYKVSASAESVSAFDGLRGTAVMSDAHSGAPALPPPDVEAQRDAKAIQVEMEIEHPTVLQRPQSITRPLITRTAYPDYGWLMDALRTKVDEVKVYPRAAKLAHAKGRVVVQVSIQGDGRIVSPEIEESSGYPMLDQAALDTVLAASPLKLDHLLEGMSVVMLVPLNYQLE